MPAPVSFSGRRRLSAAVLAALTVTLSARPIAGQLAAGVDVGTFGGYTRFDRSLILPDRPGTGGEVTLRLGDGPAGFRLEGGGAYTQTVYAGATATVTEARALLLYEQPLVGRASLVLGPGGVRTSYQGRNTTDYGITGLAALRIRLFGDVALRIAAVEDYMPSPANKAWNNANNWNAHGRLGLSVPLLRLRSLSPDPVIHRGPIAAASAPATGAPIVPVESAAARAPGSGGADIARAAPIRGAESGSPIAARPDVREAAGPDPVGASPRTAPRGTAAPHLPGAHGEDVVLQGVTFRPWSAALTPEAVFILEVVAQELVTHPDVEIAVVGHSDARGPRTRNARIARERAEAVRAFLASRGVDPARVHAGARGPTEPLASNRTASGRMTNRRVDLRRIN